MVMHHKNYSNQHTHDFVSTKSKKDQNNDFDKNYTIEI
jgi:hypothetical protein